MVFEGSPTGATFHGESPVVGDMSAAFELLNHSLVVKQGYDMLMILRTQALDKSLVMKAVIILQCE